MFKKLYETTKGETKAKQLGFRILQKTIISITPSEVIHTFKRHGENSSMVKNGNQKKPLHLMKLLNIKIMQTKPPRKL
ncbi:hypothetical protein LS77_009710 [Helicobacter bilis]|uniref:Uncharacterized protein n=1 Tax=Helicobacter bilis TaxID=37372 RepID=A0A6D2C937_9HELI|nr:MULTISPECIES: hypothetical protein [Helicobacter]MDY5951421.1 hypothetical protein [Helicobacter sp.]TLE03004.1 hypothetical protein LS77_009710 [Helicobacter bilis]TLE03831.1 hypothetical protein LS76_009655 [Helicobacter bilis]